MAVHPQQDEPKDRERAGAEEHRGEGRAKSLERSRAEVDHERARDVVGRDMDEHIRRDRVGTDHEERKSEAPRPRVAGQIKDVVVRRQEQHDPAAAEERP